MRLLWLMCFLLRICFPNLFQYLILQNISCHFGRANIHRTFKSLNFFSNDMLSSAKWFDNLAPYNSYKYMRLSNANGVQTRSYWNYQGHNMSRFLVVYLPLLKGWIETWWTLLVSLKCSFENHKAAVSGQLVVNDSVYMVNVDAEGCG